MQIGSECFKDEQLCYMIESAQKLGRCDITVLCMIQTRISI